mgnify:CR=1 FL=1
MRYQDANFPEVENVGLIDGTLRGSVSIASRVAVLLIPTMPVITLIGLTFVAIYTGLTAFLSWDPFYALVKKSQPQPPTPASAPVTADRSRVEHAVDAEHKKAA